MSYIEELRTRVETAERRFGLIDEQHAIPGPASLQSRPQAHDAAADHEHVGRRLTASGDRLIGISHDGKRPRTSPGNKDGTRMA